MVDDILRYTICN